MGKKRSDVVWIMSDIIFPTSDIVFPMSYVVFRELWKVLSFLVFRHLQGRVARAMQTAAQTASQAAPPHCNSPELTCNI